MFRFYHQLPDVPYCRTPPHPTAPQQRQLTAQKRLPGIDTEQHIKKEEIVDESVAYIRQYVHQDIVGQASRKLPNVDTAEAVMINWEAILTKYCRSLQQASFQNSIHPPDAIDDYIPRITRDHFPSPRFPSWNTTIPSNLPLQTLASKYPNHLFGDHLKRFMNERDPTGRKWTPRKIFQLLDPEAQAVKAHLKQPWSWIAKRIRYLDPDTRKRESHNNRRIQITRRNKARAERRRVRREEQAQGVKHEDQEDNNSGNESVESTLLEDYTISVFNDPNWAGLLEEDAGEEEEEEEEE